jgi:hypothetical protein
MTQPNQTHLRVLAYHYSIKGFTADVCGRFIQAINTKKICISGEGFVLSPGFYNL